MGDFTSGGNLPTDALLARHAIFRFQRDESKERL